MTGALLMVAAVATVPSAAGRGGALSPVEMAAGLRRLTLSVNPELLTNVRLAAVETWTPAAAGSRAEVETDGVFYYHSVPIEVQQTEDDRPLDAGAERAQKKLALQLEGLIDTAVAGDGHGNAGRLLDLDGDIWSLDTFQSHFSWRGERGPLFQGRPTLVLQFTPATGVHPHSRLARLLSRTAGEIDADAQTGQILAGSFHSLGPVRFGAGILADVSFFDGHFTMQPVSTPQGECWVLRQAQVKVRSRELFSHHNGTETMTYTVAPPPLH